MDKEEEGRGERSAKPNVANADQAYDGLVQVGVGDQVGRSGCTHRDVAPLDMLEAPSGQRARFGAGPLYPPRDGIASRCGASRLPFAMLPSDRS